MGKPTRAVDQFLPEENKKLNIYLDLRINPYLNVECYQVRAF